MKPSLAPGAPGMNPSWCSSDKDLVGTAFGPARLWYTIGHGILNEVYYPRIDIPQIRDLGFIIADGEGFWVEVKRLTSYQMHLPEAGIPLPTIVFSHPRFILNLSICPDPERDSLLIDVELEGDENLRPYVLLAPHLGGSGHENLGWAATHRGRKLLWAQQGPFGLALVAVDKDFRDAYRRTSAGYAGVSDLWQDFSVNGRMSQEYREAGPGNIALAGELPRHARLALGVSTSKEAAATLAVSSLAQGFAGLFEQQLAAWQEWHRERESKAPMPPLTDMLVAQYRTSAMVLKCHRDKTFTGAMVASLSVPWGNSGEERGGYHLVWPRDLVESATALLALGGILEARNVLRYLIATQNDDGHWHQNQWLGGKPYWEGLQLDEAAFPVLLAAILAEHGSLDNIPVQDMISRALGFLIREGPSSPQDRWEEDAGVNAFTVAVCIAALVAGAGFLPPREAELALGVADFWNSRLEDWTVARDRSPARDLGIDQYYVRVAPAAVVGEPGALCRNLQIKNRADNHDTAAADQVALDFLQLVRLGLRRADDPLVSDTVRLADALLGTDTPAGTVWHRYTGDGYGEHPDGGPFDGTGIGRGWPLLCGERGHYALAAGEDPTPFLQAMSAMAGRGGLLPEQVWDSEAIPERGLFPGRPTGSAMPLAWAHGEFVKLVASSGLNRPFDRLDCVWARYRGNPPQPDDWIWTPGAAIHSVPRDKGLIMLLTRPAVFHLGDGNWSRIRDLETRELGFGLHGLTLSAAELLDYDNLAFTWYWQDDGQWQGENFHLRIVDQKPIS